MTTREKLAEAAKVMSAWYKTGTHDLTLSAVEDDALSLLCSAAECGTVGEEPQRVRCADCRWLDASTCRRYPPTTEGLATVSDDEWCGEGQKCRS